MADDERFKPEWQDFEKRFHHQMEDYLEKMNGLPPDNRAKTEDKIRERLRQHEKATAELEKKEPDFYNPSTQGKHMSLVEFLHHDADMMAKKAHEAQQVRDDNKFDRARKTAATLRASQAQSQPGKDHDRER